MTPAALAALADAADALARLARAALAEGQGDSELMPLPAAARRAATSVRVLREAIRKGELAAFGRQRDRAVKVSDLHQWAEGRRVQPGPSDPELEARMERLARQKRSA